MLVFRKVFRTEYVMYNNHATFIKVLLICIFRPLSLDKASLFLAHT